MMPKLRSSPFRRRALAALALATTLPLAGCGTIGSLAKTLSASFANLFDRGPTPAYLDLDGLTLTVDAEANGRSAFAVDLVFIKDAKTLETLQATPASKWFATRTDLLRTYPESLSVRGWELVPRQTVKLDRDALGSPRVAGVLIFADYRAAGEHRALLPDLRDGATIRFGPTGFDVVARNR